MQYNLLSTDPKAEYATAWQANVGEARNAAQLPPCKKILLLLFLATLLLQAIAALQRHYINPDGVTYLYIANLLAEGHLQAGLSGFGVNTFIYMLTFFQWLGFDPLYSGIWWNAIMSSLAVLPLFGWVRRMFDTRLAIIASLLYGFHPIVLSIGSSLMRGPMFWLFFNLVIYCSWRAITEIRLRWFLLAGCSLTLAIHTRSEAWFLVIPILLWALGRFWFASRYRIQLIFGILLLFAIIPGSIATLNFTILKACPQWGIFRPSHARQLNTLCKKTKEQIKEFAPQTNTENNKSATPTTTNKTDARSAKAMSPKTPKTKSTTKKQTNEPKPVPSYAIPALRRTLLRVIKSYTYLYGVFVLIGLCIWRGKHRFALNSMFLVAIPLFVLVWYQSCSYDVSPRYFLSIVMISLPIIALGLLWTTRKIASRFSRNDETENRSIGSIQKPVHWLTSILVLTLIISCFGTIWGTNLSEQKECELGKWILKQFGPDQKITCINRQSRMAAWYAKTNMKTEFFYPVRGPNKNITKEAYLAWFFRRFKPRVILCWENYRCPQNMPGLFETLKKHNYYGYQVVETGILDEAGPKVIVLVRKDPNVVSP